MKSPLAFTKMGQVDLLPNERDALKSTTETTESMVSYTQRNIPLRIIRKDLVGPTKDITEMGLQEIPLGQKVHEDIDSGKYECCICSESIDREDKIWHCGQCWIVLHYDCSLRVACGRNYAIGDSPTLAGTTEWKCPQCRNVYYGHPLQLCCKYHLQYGLSR